MKPLSLTPAFAALALGVAALPVSVSAAELSSGPVVAAGNALLTVSAQGRTTRTPELAIFNAGVSSTGTTAGEALSANSVDMNRVIAALKRAGIADRDIQTSNLSLNPVYAQPKRQPDGSYENAPPRIIGYQVNNNVTVKQRKLSEFGKVIDTLVAAGANQVNGPSFEMDSPEAALNEARTDAIKKARERANLYAGAAGLRVVRIVTISESGGYVPQPKVMYARMEAADAASAPPPVAAGELELNANVTVQFELAP